MIDHLSELAGPELPEMSPVRKFIVLVLWQAQEDQADDVVIGEPTSHQVPIRYRVGGTWYEMTPFPEEIREAVHRVVAEMAGHRGPVQFPWHGKIDLDVTPNLRLSWSVELQAEAGRLHFSKSRDE